MRLKCGYLECLSRYPPLKLLLDLVGLLRFFEVGRRARGLIKDGSQESYGLGRHRKGSLGHSNHQSRMDFND